MSATGFDDVTAHLGTSMPSGGGYIIKATTPQKWRHDPAFGNVLQSAANNLAIPTERLHSAIGYITPQEAEEAFYADLNNLDKVA